MSLFRGYVNFRMVFPKMIGHSDQTAEAIPPLTGGKQYGNLPKMRESLGEGTIVVCPDISLNICLIVK